DVEYSKWCEDKTCSECDSCLNSCTAGCALEGKNVNYCTASFCVCSTDNYCSSAQEQSCSDGTIYGTCSTTKLKYCDNGNLVPDCNKCGCLSGNCQLDTGTCSFSIPPIGVNAKQNLYSNKEVFLVSDADWKNVLPFVSVTVWTEGSEVKKYPFLIYHDEGDGIFDADSIIYFMQQYFPSKVTFIGNTNIELDNLLVASPHLGAGLSEAQIQRVSAEDYLFYWSQFNNLVYVQDDYELSLLASTYASLINAPMIIKGSGLDSASIFSGRNVICVGNVVPAGSSCSETYDLSSLRQKYKTETGTDKIILVNSKDYSPFYSSSFCPEKSYSCIQNLYYKDSLIAPILASARQELLLSIDVPQILGDSLSYPSPIKSFLSPFLSGANYLTIFASKYAVPDRIKEHGVVEVLVGDDFWTALDPAYYADTNGDNKPDVSVGRIAGISSSDVSSYIARDLFFNSFQKTNNVKLLASSFGGTLKKLADNPTFLL
ncbi:MAG: hypothetical protein AABX99_04020, partial [Nanoarchaeota archaeon]